MVRRFLLALVALCFATISVAQSFPQPPDVPAFSQVTPLFKTDGTINYPIDSTVTPMPIGSGLTNIPVPSLTNRIVTTADMTEAKFTAKIDNGSGAAGTTLTVSAMTSGTINPGTSLEYLVGTGIPAQGLKIASQLTGTTGGVGTYSLTNIDGSAMTALLIASESMISTDPSSYCLGTSFGGPSGCPENKFRTFSQATTIAPDDPQRNYGQPGGSHLHQFFGGANCNAYSTYKSIRAHALTSTLSGTDVNATCYWFPAITVSNPYADGKNFAIQPDWITVYYTENPGTNGTGLGLKAHIPAGLRYVFGFDMDAAWSGGSAQQYAWYQTALNAANTAIGHTRYTLQGQSFVYTCAGATPNQVGTLMTSAGADPYGGTCEAAIFTGSISSNLLTVSAMTSGTIRNGLILYVPGATQAVTVNSQASGTTGGVGTYNLSTSPNAASQTLRAVPDFFIAVTGPTCYDGTNLWSPGGYKNLIMPITDADNSKIECPYNYYQLPGLVLEIHFTQYGWADRQRWDLSSDIAYRAKWGLTTAQFPPGSSFHTDWMDGWDHLNGMNVWQDKCLGVEHQTAHQCNTSQIGPTQRLQGGVPGEAGAGGRSPQVNTSSKPHALETDSQWELIPPSWSGGMSGMKIHN